MRARLNDMAKQLGIPPASLSRGANIISMALSGGLNEEKAILWSLKQDAQGPPFILVGFLMINRQ